jgi:hypothetical protein
LVLLATFLRYFFKKSNQKSPDEARERYWLLPVSAAPPHLPLVGFNSFLIVAAGVEPRRRLYPAETGKSQSVPG